MNIHSGGATLNQGEFWDKHAEQDDFIEAMAEAAETVVNHFGSNIAFVNIAWQPFGRLRLLRSSRRSLHEGHRIFASLDPVAIDAACLDAVRNSDDPGRDTLLERITSRHGEKIIDDAVRLGYGSADYELIEV